MTDQDNKPMIVRLAEDFAEDCIKAGYVSTVLPSHARLMEAARALPAAAAPSGWLPIESANKAPTLLLGYWNENGKWRTTRGCWFTKEQIEDTWEDDEMPEGWYETPVEGDACYLIHPTHWQPLPAAPDA